MSNQAKFLLVLILFGLSYFNNPTAMYAQSKDTSKEPSASKKDDTFIIDLTVEEQIEILLNHPNPIKRRFVALLLGDKKLRAKKSELVFFSLIIALNDKDKLVRKNVIRSLGQHKNKLACPQLITSLNESDLDIKNQTIRSLGIMQQNCEGLKWQLKKYLDHKDTTIQISTVWTLTKLKLKDSLRLLIKKLFDKKATVRAYTAQQITEFRDSESIPFLKKVYEYDESIEVRQAAAIALRQLGESVSLPIDNP